MFSFYTRKFSWFAAKMCPRCSDPESNDSAVVTGSVNPSPGPDQDTHFDDQSAHEKPSLDLQNIKYFYLGKAPFGFHLSGVRMQCNAPFISILSLQIVQSQERAEPRAENQESRVLRLHLTIMIQSRESPVSWKVKFKTKMMRIKILTFI
jgi:hypothetical protein